MEAVDVSHHQGAIDWPRVRAAGIELAILKATEGTTFVDSRYRSNVAGARAAGLIVGAYHFGRPGSSGPADAEAEAAHFLRVTAQQGRPDFYVLDIEDDRVPAGRRLGAWMIAFLHEVERTTKRIPWLYSYGPYWREHGSSDQDWRRYPWWLADYSPPPAQVAPWGRPSLWQYTSSGNVPGIAGRCDRNLFDGSAGDFRRLIGIAGGAPPQPAPPPLDPPTDHGDNMKRIPVRITTDGDGRGYADVPVPHTNVVNVLLNGDEPSDGWGPYVGAPAYAIRKDTLTRVVVPESPIRNGYIDLVLWAVE